MTSLLGKWLAFAVLMGAVILTASDWRRADDWLFATVFNPVQAKPHPNILLIELPDVGANDPSPRVFREFLGHVLEELAHRNPKQVAVDIAVEEGGASLPAVAHGVKSLRQAGVSVYFGVHPRFVKDNKLARSVYVESGLTGVGHTELRLGRGLAFFHAVRVEAATGKEIAYLPALLASDIVDPWALPEYQVFSVPKDSSQPLTVPIDRSLSKLPARMDELTVIVASSERECRQLREAGPSAAHEICADPGKPRIWSGPELLVWSLTDLLKGRAAKVPVSDPVWMLVAGLGAAAAALLAHLIGVRGAGRFWSPTALRSRLWIVSLGALLVVLGLLVLAEYLLLQLGWMLPPTFPALAAAMSIGLCHLHARGHLAELLAAMTRRATDEALKADVDVFISYSHEPANAAWVEREIVEPLRAMRLADGKALRLFFDKSSITVGQSWFRRINLGILGSRCFLSVWSDDYLERAYCQWELDYAFPLAARPAFLFLPVAHRSDGKGPGPEYAQYLQARQFIDAATRPDFAAEITAALRAHLDGTQ